jgi:predicted nucleic acid-binding protein
VAQLSGLLDTSVVIAATEDEVGVLPGNYAISVMTLAELHKGAAMAPTRATRAARIARLATIEQLFEALPVDRRVALRFGEIAGGLARATRRPHVIDALIAATAIVYDVPVVTLDEGFDRIPGVRVVRPGAAD